MRRSMRGWLLAATVGLMSGGVPAVGCNGEDECPLNLGTGWTQINAPWTTSPAEDEAGNLTAPRVSDVIRLIIGNDRTTGRNGHPNSRGTASFECNDGGGGQRCTIKYAISHFGRVRDAEALTVTFTSPNRPAQTFTFRANDAWAQHLVTFEGCATVNVEVKANAGTDPSNIASRFDFVLQSRKCHNCPTT